MRDALSIAGIHATVVSIFVAVFSTYGLFLQLSQGTLVLKQLYIVLDIRQLFPADQTVNCRG